ncbi:dynein intermediate chain [Pseudozyma hubeiensis SY62]|uniref:Dynein intermediate chain n=1 Tax=Pseudozyma hubeiensis (strain SY62) TaxID=1305764 RepID=R9P0V6_PSEHS|nr:dynein intermediate chain [Pseudozyma hubeiensis SY62]GAC94806.1 dynein intermediate chain [Pseudozyma hubeiensis SY62]
MSSSPSSSVAHRKAQIEAKKAKLEEIRRQREERAQRLKSTATTSSANTQDSFSSRRDLDDLVNSLISGSSVPASTAPSVGTRPSSPRKSLIGGGTSRVVSGSGGAHVASSEIGESESEVPSTPVKQDARSERLELIDVEKELFELPQKQRVFYTKEVQTSSTDDFSGQPSGGVGTEPRPPPVTEESLRAKILSEQAADLAARQEESRLEQEIAEQLRELTAEERLAVYSVQEFSDFVEHSTKIVERALTDTYDYMRDYRGGVEDFSAEAGRGAGSQLRLIRKFGEGDARFAGRSVMGLDWSSKYPELCCAAYNRTRDGADDASDGLVALWNTHLTDRPEFTFTAPTDVTSVTFSPFHPTLVVGGTYSGQILIWDTRSRQLPVLKTPLSASGHTHPVYGLKIIGSTNANNLVSSSTDGTVCWWMLDVLGRAQETLELVNASGNGKTDEVAVSCLGMVERETTSFLVGSEDGNVYQGNRYDRAGLKAGLNAGEVYRGHVGPITAIDFHPLNGGSVDFSDLFLTSSMDWTSKLWRLRPSNTIKPAAAKGFREVLSFEESNDYIYDVKWSPIHPAVFAQVDGTGKLEVFNLNVDTERPVASVSPTTTTTTSTQQQNVGDGGVLMEGVAGRALNKLAWSKDGKKLATGGSDGVVYVYDVGEALWMVGEEEFEVFREVVGRLLTPESAVTGTTGRT